MILKYKWQLIKLVGVIIIATLIMTGQIHNEEAFVFGSIGMVLILNIFTGWNPFCNGGCFKKNT